MSLHLMQVKKLHTQKMHVHILLDMLSLTGPGGALGAARSFFTPPTVTPVDGPASWFAAQRTSRSLGAGRPEGATDGFGTDVEEFDLGGDADLDALDAQDLARERRAA